MRHTHRLTLSNESSEDDRSRDRRLSDNGRPRWCSLLPRPLFPLCSSCIRCKSTRSRTLPLRGFIRTFVSGGGGGQVVQARTKAQEAKRSPRGMQTHTNIHTHRLRSSSVISKNIRPSTPATTSEQMIASFTLKLAHDPLSTLFPCLLSMPFRKKKTSKKQNTSLIFSPDLFFIFLIPHLLRQKPLSVKR